MLVSSRILAFLVLNGGFIRNDVFRFDFGCGFLAGDGSAQQPLAIVAEQAQLARITHFFEHYKDLEKGKWTRIEGWYGIEKARELIEAAVKRGQAEGA